MFRSGAKLNLSATPKVRKQMKALIITLMALTCSTLLAAEIGKLVVVKGPVELVSVDGTKSPAKALQALSEGDKLQTGAGGYVKLMMKDESVFQVGPNSEFGFDKFEMKSKNERTAVYNLAKGQLRSWFVHKSPEKTLTIKTPTASMGIRGTEILTDVYQSSVGETKTDIALIRGKLEVASGSLGGRVMLEPGQLLDGLGSKLAGRAPASAREALLKKLPSKVFDAVRKNSISPNGAIFLHEARQKFGREKLGDKFFGGLKDSSQNRAPASVDGKQLKRKRDINIDKGELREKLVNRIDTDQRKKLRQQVISNQIQNKIQEKNDDEVKRQPASTTNTTTINSSDTPPIYVPPTGQGGVPVDSDAAQGAPTGTNINTVNPTQMNQNKIKNIFKALDR